MKLRYSLVLAALIGIASQAQTYLLTGTTYSQSFDSLITTGVNQTWGNDSTLDGWSLFNSAGAAITTYTSGTGSSNAGAFYSFGATASTDRALGGTASGGAYFGSPGAGNLAGYIVFGVTNGSGTDFSNVTLGYSGEQWRDGGAMTPAAQTMVLEYGLGSTYAGVGAWTAAGSSFNFTSPVFTNTSSGVAVDGNSAGLVTGLGGVLSVAWTAGDTLWVRFREDNNFGNDHGLAVDNFSLSASAASAIPEPSTYAAILGGLVLVGAVVHRRRQVSA